MNLAEEDQDIMGDKTFRLSGTAVPHDAAWMLDEMCEHFVEHATVERSGSSALLKSPLGTASFELVDGRIRIAIAAPTGQFLQLAQNSIAEHMFYFAGEKPLELTWSDVAEPKPLPNFREVTVVRTQEVTPHMRRVVFRCEDVSPFIGGGMHVRLLIPPKNRTPVWPVMGADGRLSWPKGEDELVVRVYTIRFVDTERKELWVDFLQHPMPGVSTPGADFACDAFAGQTVAFLGPGGGDMPEAKAMLLSGDESALPAIARIIAEAPAGTRIRAIVELEDEKEEQPLPGAGEIDVLWLHRKDYRPGAPNRLVELTRDAIASADGETFVWVACEKDDLRVIRALLKERKHDRRRMYAAWYWERSQSASASEAA
jgi:NADPH-dependent ferric siderophore reductase